MCMLMKGTVMAKFLCIYTGSAIELIAHRVRDKLAAILQKTSHINAIIKKLMYFGLKFIEIHSKLPNLQ